MQKEQTAESESVAETPLSALHSLELDLPLGLALGRGLGRLLSRGAALGLRSLLLGLGLALVSVALNGVTDDVLFNIPSSMLLWLMCGLIFVIRRL